jgi:GNAT superfamily N-acetyltransferase
MSGSRRQDAAAALDIHPLTPARFDDLVTLFSGRGGSQVRSCWCMYYRRSGRTAVPEGMTYAERNRRDLKALVDSGVVPGLIGYRDGKPVAWVSVGPREQYHKLAKSPVMKPVDDKPVWSVVCFYTALEARNAGVSAAMLRHAARFAQENGATLLEAYPVDGSDRARDDAMWFGAKRMYDAAGFREVARRKPRRPIVRKALRSR